MKIEGANFGNYDSRYLQVVQRDTAQSIRPNVFREVDNGVEQALRFTDEVTFSPEAQQLLRKLRKQLSGRDKDTAAGKAEVEQLIYNLRQLRDLVHDQQDQQDQEGAEAQEGGSGATGQTRRHSNQPPMLPLGGPGRAAGRAPAKPGGVCRDIVERMLAYAPNASARERIKDELVPLGEKMLDTVARFGVHIIVLEPNRPLTGVRVAGMTMVAPGERTFDGRPWEGVRGLYDQSRRIMVIGEENLGHPSRSAARHEFAHAFDHTFTARHQRRQPLSVQLWNLFASQRRGLVTPYAGTNPAEYFAETVEAFFKPDGRNEVLKLDPQMFEYLETLFAA